jgi:hypothetical protein
VAPTVQILVNKTLHVTSPGNIPLAVYAFDPQGLDRLLLSLSCDSTATIAGDSTYFFSSPNEQTISLVWSLPPGVPFDAKITLVAKVLNVFGFGTSDTLILPVLR